MSDLKPGQFESILFTYGYLEDGIILSRATTEKMAKIVIGSESRYLDGGQMRPARIISTRLEDDSPSDPTKGRVIAICEPVVSAPDRPYRPQGMETK